MVTGNETLLRSLVTNLLENACKYSPDSTAHVLLEKGAGEVRLVVENRGEGIALEHQERVFEPFFRADNTGRARGHGIGLSLALRIVQLHGGSIALQSAPGEGARFTVRLPKAG